MVKGVLVTIQRFWQFVTPVRSIPAKGLEINPVTKSSVQFLPTEHPVLYCMTGEGVEPSQVADRAYAASVFRGSRTLASCPNYQSLYVRTYYLTCR